MCASAISSSADQKFTSKVLLLFKQLSFCDVKNCILLSTYPSFVHLTPFGACKSASFGRFVIIWREILKEELYKCMITITVPCIFNCIIRRHVIIQTALNLNFIYFILWSSDRLDLTVHHVRTTMALSSSLACIGPSLSSSLPKLSKFYSLMKRKYQLWYNTT